MHSQFPPKQLDRRGSDSENEKDAICSEASAAIITVVTTSFAVEQVAFSLDLQAP